MSTLPHIYISLKCVGNRPAQLAELPRSKFDPELFPHRTYVEICMTFTTRVFNILQQYVTNFDVGNGERGRKWRENEEMEREGGNRERMINVEG